MDLKQQTGHHKAGFRQFLLEQPTSDPQFPLFEVFGVFCARLGQPTVRFDQSMTELDVADKQAVVEMEANLGPWTAPSPPRMEEEGWVDGEEFDDWLRKQQESGEVGEDSDGRPMEHEVTRCDPQPSDSAGPEVSVDEGA